MSACFATGVDTWEAQTSGSTKQMDGIFTMSPAMAVAVGFDRTILKTTDYGANWAAKKAELTNRNLYAVHFPSASIGFAAGHNAANNWSYILKSTDGGESWDDNLDSSTDIQAIYDIFFINDTTGWACGSISGTNPSIIYTTNGGTSWNNLGGGAGKPGVYTYEGIFFVNASTGWVVGHDNGTSGGKIYKTTDSGSNWAAENYPDLKNADRLFDVYFINATTGWIAGYIHDFGVGGTNAMVLKTTDGGANWTTNNSGLTPSFNAVDFIDANNGWAAGFGNFAEVEQTTDGGTTNWSNVYRGATNNMYDIDVADLYNGWAVGGNGLIVRHKVDPTITSIAPSTANQGDTLGVVIQGTNFLEGLTSSSLTFSASGVTVNSLTRDSDSQISVNISIGGAATTGLSDITLTNADAGFVTETNAFSINPVGVTPPTITSITPEAGGQNAVGMTVTIIGSNFHTASTPEVVFRNGGITVNSLTNDATSITANISISATAATTWRTVSVQNTDDSGITSKNNLFKVNPAPSISTLIPRPSPVRISGLAGASGSYYIKGDNFADGAAVSFSPSGITATSVQYQDAQTLIAELDIASSAAAGNYSMTVTNRDNGRGIRNNIFSVTLPTTNAEASELYAYPNPWNPTLVPQVSMQVKLSKVPTDIKLVLATINGVTIKEFEFTATKEYTHVLWDGITSIQEEVPNGIYLVTVIDKGKNTKLGCIKVMVVR
ncbi:MAG: IPT/TIG domain-containing protein [Candidatus Saganbacteria bacterium]|nr:IPT/TIG domain-containing protein [Candidatus Saganbacteria bacterium]